MAHFVYLLKGLRQGVGGSYFPYILLNEIQTMLSQLAKRSARFLPTDLCTDHAHYVKNRLGKFFCWVCGPGLSEPLPHYSLFCDQL